MKLKKGDTIVVLAGKDKGKTGAIEKVFPKKNTVLIPGINIFKRHMKKRDEKQQAGIVERPRPLHASKVAFVDKKTKQASRIGFIVTKGEKLRVSKRSGQHI